MSLGYVQPAITSARQFPMQVELTSTGKEQQTVNVYDILYALSSVLSAFSLVSAAIDPVEVIIHGGEESAFRVAASALLALSFACKIPYLLSKSAKMAVFFMYMWVLGWSTVSLLMVAAVATNP